MDIKSYFSGNKLASNQSVIIGRDGNVRVANTFEEALPLEVVISNSQFDSQFDSQSDNLTIGFVDESSNIQDISGDIDDIIEALEAGEDPTELGEEFATTSGGQVGSSPSSVTSVVRTAEQTSPKTAFETEGDENEFGLTRTQSLSLVEQFRAFQQDPVLTDENGAPLASNLFAVTDEDKPVSGKIFATDPNPQDLLSFAVSSGPSNGRVSVDPVTGGWEYIPNENFDGPDSFQITVSDGNGGTDTATVNIDVTPIPELSLSGPTDVIEGEDAVYIVSLDKPSTQDTQVNISLSTNSAELNDLATIVVTTPQGLTLSLGADGVVSIPAGVTSLTISVGTADDAVFEGSEGFQLELNSGFGTVGRETQATLIEDNDIPNLTVRAETVVEGQAALFDVALSNEVDGDVRYEFTIDLDGQSAEWADFASNPLSVTYKVDGTSYNAATNNDGSYTIPGNASDIQVSVQTSDDTIFEGAETFNLEARASATAGGDSFSITDSGIGTITDNRDGANNADTPTLSVSGDTLVEGQAAMFDVILSNQVDGDVRYEFTLDLDGQSAESADFASNPMSVTYKVDGTSYTAAMNNDGSYTIPGNASDIQVSVQTSDDTIFEGAETFDLDARASATVGGDSFTITDSGTGTITDNRDGANNADTPTLSVSGETVVEGQAALFDVALSNEVDG
ncbi:Ig-like domain-containing protein, partial [Vibrio sp.]|uniref:Ig-like domain-containing protein n=1 Tax=Vibrio sp. TaxID=678 RepID=UPI00311E976E